MTQLSNSTDSSTCAPASTRTPRPRMEFRTTPPETIEPPDKIELNTSPARPRRRESIWPARRNSRRAQRPLAIVQIQRGRGRAQVHAGVVISVDGSHVAPVRLLRRGISRNMVDLEIVGVQIPPATIFGRMSRPKSCELSGFCASSCSSRSRRWWKRCNFPWTRTPGRDLPACSARRDSFVKSGDPSVRRGFDHAELGSQILGHGMAAPWPAPACVSETPASRGYSFCKYDPLRRSSHNADRPAQSG